MNLYKYVARKKTLGDFSPRNRGTEAPDSHGHWWLRMLRWWHNGTLFLNDRRPRLGEGTTATACGPIFLSATNYTDFFLGNWHQSVVWNTWASKMITTTIWEKPWEHLEGIDGWLTSVDPKKQANNFHLWDVLGPPDISSSTCRASSSSHLRFFAKATMLSWCQGVSLSHWWKRFYPFNCKIGGSIAISVHLGGFL